MTSTAVLPADTRLGSVQIRVSELERSILFYEKVVGLKLLSREKDRAELTADGRTPLLILRQIAAPRPLGRSSAAGLYHFAILLPDRPSLGLVLRNMIDAGIHIGQGDHLVSEALYIQDPDNNGIELYADRPRSGWKRDSEGYYVMTTDPVDVDGLLAASAGLVWNGLPAGTVIGHVHFHVGNLERAKSFYCGVLGFELTAYYGGAALFVSAGGYHHHIGLNVWAGEGAAAAPADAPNIDFFTIVVPAPGDLEVIRQRAAAAGVETAGDSGMLTLTDPWNIGIRMVAAE